MNLRDSSTLRSKGLNFVWEKLLVANIAQCHVLAVHEYSP